MTPKKRGRKQGAVMMVWLFFANLFDPSKAAAIEHIDTTRRIGNETRRAKAGSRPSTED
jgi:hypothetical protein